MTEIIHIDLSCTSDHYGIIFPARTGVRYSTQAGGHACMHPSLEGFYIPLSPRPIAAYVEGSHENYWGGYNTSSMADIDKLMSEMGAELTLRAPSIEQVQEQLVPFFRIKGSFSRSVDESECGFAYGEAWIPVLVQLRESDHANGLYCSLGDDAVHDKELAGRCGVLTWENSD